MDGYYDVLTAHKIKLDNIYNTIAEMWEESEKPRTITLAEDNDYQKGVPIIFKGEKYYVTELRLNNAEVHIGLRNFNTDYWLIDEILWYGNHDLKILVIDEVAKHLGYSFEIGEKISDDKKKKKKKHGKK